MSVSAIETLMQIATPPRAAEPASRPGGETKRFAPALEEAYGAKKLREPAARPEDDEPSAPAADETDDFDGAAEERAEEAAQPTESATSEEAEAAEDESGDEVVISELASTVVAANETKQSAAADEQKALELVAEIAAGDGSEEAASAPSGDAGAEGEANGQAELNEELAALRGKALAETTTSADVESTPTKSAGRAKAKKGETLKSELPSETSSAAAGEKDSQAVAVAVQQEPNPLVEEQAESAPIEQAGKDSDAKSTKADGVERVNLPQIEQTAELAAAIERHVAMVEQSTGAEAATADLSAAASPTEGASANSLSRATATLDRLAAASLRRNESAASNEGGPAIDRNRFIQRVEGALKAAQQRDGRVQVRLAPPELGSLRIDLSVQNGVMAAKLEAETPAARNALLDNLPALRERLAEQNIRVEKFDVDIRRDSQGSGGNSAAFDGGDRRNEAGADERRDRSAPLPQPKTTVRTSRAPASTSDAGLDVRI
jgi:flagellar hook-length control protein FliK